MQASRSAVKKRQSQMFYGVHTYKAKEWKNCQQTALINHASINHFLPPSPLHPLWLTKPGENQHLWPSSCFGLLLTSLPPPPLSLHSVPPSLFRSFHPSIGGSLEFHGCRALCASPIRWYNFCGVVKQLQGRSCSFAGANYTVCLVLKAPLLSKVVF